MSARKGRPDPAGELRAALDTTFANHREALVRGLLKGARARDGRRGGGTGPSRYQHQRAVQLVESFLEGPEAFVGHIQRVAAARGSGALGTPCLWWQLTALEPMIWSIVAREVHRDHQVTLLGWVTRTIGAAKDQVMGSGVAQLRQSRAWARTLEERLCSLTRAYHPVPDGAVPHDAEEAPGR